MNELEVVSISPVDAMPWILNRHYAKRSCPISFAFGAFRNKSLIGIVTYGTPASSPLRDGVCGSRWSSNVLELNRLCCDSEANLASFLVGRSLRLLPKPSIVVSYADKAQGHVGYVYQATNFLYTGLSAKRTDWAVKGLEHLHGATIADQSRGKENRAEWMREKYGDDFYLKERSRKEKLEMKADLLYEIEPYPKGNSKRYDASQEITTQRKLL